MASGPGETGGGKSLAEHRLLHDSEVEGGISRFERAIRSREGSPTQGAERMRRVDFGDAEVQSLDIKERRNKYDRAVDLR